MQTVRCPSCGKPVHLPGDFAGGDVMCANCDARFTVEPPRPDPAEILAVSVAFIGKWFLIALGISIAFFAAFFCWGHPALLWLGILPLAVFQGAALVYGLAYLRTIALK